MNDWIGTPKGVTSSAPPWPRHWRKWWDPRAPQGKSNQASPPTLNPIPPYPQEPIEISGTGCPGGQIWIHVEPGSYDAWVMVDEDGNWTWQAEQPFPEGDYCVTVQQRCPAPDDAWSELADPACFSTGEAGQTVDIYSKGLRFASQGGWPVRGTLAYNINGTWVYGVLRHNNNGVWESAKKVGNK